MKKDPRRNTMRSIGLILLLLSVLLTSLPAHPAKADQLPEPGAPEEQVIAEQDVTEPETEIPPEEASDDDSEGVTEEAPAVASENEEADASEPEIPEASGDDLDGVIEEDPAVKDETEGADASELSPEAALTTGGEEPVRGKEPYEVEVRAIRDITDTYLEGAVIQYFDIADASTVKTHTTTVPPGSVQLQRNVTYRFSSTLAPVGYDGGERDIECMMDDAGIFHIRTAGETGWSTFDYPRVIKFFYGKLFPIVISKVAEDAPDKELEGARLKLDSFLYPHLFEGDSGAPNFPMTLMLPEGYIYAFRELSAPAGYSLAGPIFFGFEETGKVFIQHGFDHAQVIEGDVPKLVMVNRPQFYEMNVNAVRRLTGEQLAGAVIEYFDKDDPAAVTELTTSDLPSSVKLERNKTYLFQNKKNPDGYECWGNFAIECKLSPGGKFYVRDADDATSSWIETNPMEITFYYHKVVAIELSKVAEDAPDKEQAGARLQFDWPGNPGFYVADSGAPEFPKTMHLSEGICYKFSELSAPAGYSKHEDIVFYVDKDEKIVIDSGEAKIIDNDPGHALPRLVMVNKKEAPAEELYQIHVKAIRELTGELLPDVKIDYYNTADPGTKMDLMTTDAPFPVELKRGLIYRFESKETPPASYQCWGNDSFECTMDDTGTFFVREEETAPWVETDPMEIVFYYRKMTPLSLSKVAEDAPDKEQEGARLQFGWAGEPDLFVEDSGAPRFPKTVLLAEGITYTFSELSAPAGYSKHEDIVFHLDENRKIVIESGEAVFNDDDPGHKIPDLAMVNKKEAGATPPGGKDKNKLPDTGDNGLWTLMLGSVLLLAGAVLFKPCRKVEN